MLRHVRQNNCEDDMDQITCETEPLIQAQSIGERRQRTSQTFSQPKILPQYVATFCATIGALAMGCVLGYSSPAGSILTSNSTDSNILLTSQQNSWFSSISNVGALFGGPVGGFCINYFGRRGTMIYLIVPTLGGWILLAAAQNFAMLLLGRLITGLCGGIVSLTVPTYIGELASPHIRGILGGGFQLMVVIGILFVYCLGAAFDSYQWIAAVCAITPCIFSISMIFNKESPAYLLSKGKEEEARRSLEFFRGKEYEGISLELEQMNESLRKSRENKVSFRDLKAPYIMKPLLMSLGLMFFQQFSGINAVLFNLQIIFEEAGSDMSTNVSSIIVGVVQVIATFIAASLTDKAGRKLLLLVSAATMALSLVALGLFFYLKDHGTNSAENIGWLPLLSLIVFIFGFSIGYGPVPWVMMGELFSPEVKELAGSMATSTNWTSAFIVTLLFSPLQSLLYDYGVYWLFSGFCLINFIFVLTTVYETKGKTFQEINAHFSGKKRTIEVSATLSE